MERNTFFIIPLTRKEVTGITVELCFPMKFLHTGDWHIGKKFHGFDLLEEQRDAFEQLVQVALDEQVDAIVIAGDLYDRAVPSIEAVATFNQMMYELNIAQKFPVLAISGNHDSHTRLETGGPWFEELDFHLYTRLEQAFQPIEKDGIQFFLLPYFEPYQVRRYFEDDSIRTLEQSLNVILATMQKKMKPECKQVLVAHFFVNGSMTSDSETTITVGGLDSVPLSLLSDFDYVALGHLHGKNALQAENARYSGSLVKYSLSEKNHQKGFWLVDITDEKVEYTFREIQPLRDVVELTGTFQELMESGQEASPEIREAYVAVSLTDKAIIPDVVAQLRTVYPRIFHLERQQRRNEKKRSADKMEKDKQSLNPQELFSRYFMEQTGHDLSDYQRKQVIETFEWLQKEENQ